MSVDDAMSADGARAESYRAAAAAAVAELDEIEAVTLALQARIAKMRTRATSLTSLLEVLRDVVPDAPTRPEPWSPTTHNGTGRGNLAELPRRSRRRENGQPKDELADLAVRVGPRVVDGPDITPEEVLRTGLADGKHAGPTPDVFTPVPAEVQAWG